MSWLNDTFEASMPGMLRELGAIDVTLRRPHTLVDRDEPRVVDALEVAANAGSGATSLTLRAADEGPLSGVLPAGLVLTIGGQPYTALADAAVAANQLTVIIAAPGLLAPAIAGDPVALAAEAVLSFPVSQGGGLKQDLTAKEIAPELVGQVSSRLCLARSGAPAAPRAGMIAEFGGTTARVVAIERDWEGGWDLLVGAP